MIKSAVTVEDAGTEFLKKHGKKTEKLEKSEKTEKSLNDVKGNLVLCTIAGNDESKQKKKNLFLQVMKFNKNLHSELLSMKGTGMTCTING